MVEAALPVPITERSNCFVMLLHFFRARGARLPVTRLRISNGSKQEFQFVTARASGELTGSVYHASGADERVPQGQKQRPSDVILIVGPISNISLGGINCRNR